MLRRSHLAALFAGMATVLTNDVARATYSLVAVDATERTMGGVVTSCVGSSDLSRIIHIEPNRGVIITQAASLEYAGVEGTRLLSENVTAQGVIDAITDPAWDWRHRLRQYGLVSVYGEAITVPGAFTMAYSGGVAGTVEDRFAYSAQGNVISGEEVLSNVESTFIASEACDLASRFMEALAAGALNDDGEVMGDSRCVQDFETPSNSAALLVQDWDGAPVVSLSVVGTEGSAVEALQTEFDAWRQENPCPAIEL